MNEAAIRRETGRNTERLSLSDVYSTQYSNPQSYTIHSVSRSLRVTTYNPYHFFKMHLYLCELSMIKSPMFVRIYYLLRLLPTYDGTQPVTGRVDVRIIVAVKVPRSLQELERNRGGNLTSTNNCST